MPIRFTQYSVILRRKEKLNIPQRNYCRVSIRTMDRIILRLTDVGYCQVVGEN